MSSRVGPRCTRRAWCRGLAAAAIGLAVPAAHGQLPPAERQRIERLLNAIEQDTSVRFDRNGTRVGGADAARFLRAKWARNEAGVDSAEAFIERIASRSSTSGRPYLVCAGEADCTEARVWLSARLRSLDNQSR